MEAMALGVPLLMTDYGATARRIAGEHEQRAKLIPLEDVPQAVRALTDRRQHASEWQRRADTARAWIEREHTLAPWLEKMMSLFEQAVAHRARRT